MFEAIPFDLIKSHCKAMVKNRMGLGSLLFQQQMQPGYSQSVLFHLQENERLRLQVYRLSKQLQEQRHLAESINRSHQRHLETIAAQLTLFLKSINQNNSYQQIGIINVISNCLIDLEGITFSLGSSSTQEGWQPAKTAEEQLLAEWTDKLSKADSAIHLLRAENQLLKREVTKLNEQQKQRELIASTTQEQAQALEREILQLRTQIKSAQLTQKRLRTQNDQLRSNLRESQEVSAKHIKYIRSTAKAIELQNEKLSTKHREAAIREGELITLIQQKQKQITEMKTAIESYAAQLTSSKAQLSRIIEQDQRIKQLQAQKTRKYYGFQSKPAEEDHYKHIDIEDNRINGKENIKPSTYNEENRRFNLQDFNRRLSQTHQNHSP